MNITSRKNLDNERETHHEERQERQWLYKEKPIRVGQSVSEPGLILKDESMKIDSAEQKDPKERCDEDAGRKRIARIQ
jgi:hypothetical protein